MSVLKTAIVYRDTKELNKIYDFLKQKPLYSIEGDSCLVLDMYGLNDYVLRHTYIIGLLSNERILFTFEEFKQLYFDISIGLIPFDPTLIKKYGEAK